MKKCLMVVNATLKTTTLTMKILVAKLHYMSVCAGFLAAAIKITLTQSCGYKKIGVTPNTIAEYLFDTVECNYIDFVWE